MDTTEEKITLRDYLINKSISVEQCATETKLAESTIYKVWDGTKKPGYKTLKILKLYTNGEVIW